MLKFVSRINKVAMPTTESSASCLESNEKKRSVQMKRFPNFPGSRGPNPCFKGLRKLHRHSLSIIQGNTQETSAKINIPLDQS